MQARYANPPCGPVTFPGFREITFRESRTAPRRHLPNRECCKRHYPRMPHPSKPCLARRRRATSHDAARPNERVRTCSPIWCCRTAGASQLTCPARARFEVSRGKALHGSRSACQRRFDHRPVRECFQRCKIAADYLAVDPELGHPPALARRIGHFDVQHHAPELSLHLETRPV